VRGKIMRKDLTPKKKGLVRELRRKSTPQEIILWSRLKGRKFNNLKFRRQHLVGKYIVDFICLEKKLIIELDGYQHKEKDQKQYDKERTKYLKEQGFEIVRFWNNEVNNNLEGVFLKIESCL
jgi:5-methyltetrahydrofolate--homocysteine methyltransferase